MVSTLLSRSATVDGDWTTGWRRFLWPALVIGAVLLGNLLAILHVVQVDPLVSFSSLGTAPFGAHQLMPGQWTVDLNAGATSQSLGHLAALTWLSGHVPWWNPFEGVGTPLAAGMQSGAFFPPTLLLAFQDGQIAFRVVLEVVAGLATYGLVLRLGVARPYAAVAGVLFALNGTFSWYAHAEINPVALLPVCLLGIEICRDEPLTSWKCLLLPAGVALSIVAGFPEVAFIDGLFVLLWAIVRVFEVRGGARARLALAGRLAGYMALGVGLAAPLLVAFVGYLSNGSTAAHSSDAFRGLPTGSLITMGLPYLLGPINATVQSVPAGARNTIYFNAGGFISAGAIALAITGGLFSRRERWMRLLIGAWTLLTLGRTYGINILEHAFSLIPELGRSAFWRDVQPSIELGVAILAAFGLEACFSTASARSSSNRAVDVEEDSTLPAPAHRRSRPARPTLADRVDRRWYAPIGAGLATALFAAFALFGARTIIDADAPYAGAYMAETAAWTTAVLLAVAIGGSLRRRRVGLVVVAAAVVLDAVVLFGYPQLSAPRGVTVNTAPVSYLASHLGDQRFYSLDPALGLDGGPIAPNYGSYFKLASANYLDIPVPNLYQLYADQHLDSYASPTMLDGTPFGRLAPSLKTPVQELVDNVAAYEAIGVKYVLTGSQDKAVAATGAHVVYSDPLVKIYQLTHPAPYFSTQGVACKLTASSITSVTADCPARARLVRLELDYPGWSATVNGASVPITAASGSTPSMFQSIALPAGRSVVVFSYLPSHEVPALALALACLLVLIALALYPVVRRRDTR
jgi:hypothetical protein